jgi:GNAT superfamily N-acetyltransferase
MEAEEARLAVPADAAEVTRLRLQMFRELGKTDDTWVDSCVVALSDALGRDTPELAAFVVDGSPAGQLVACGVGYLERRLPGPGGGSGVHGHIGSMYTEVQDRRRGHGRSILRALLAWFWERDAERVELWASDLSSQLSMAEGFYMGNPLWQLRRPRAQAGRAPTQPRPASPRG